jgi:dTDP-4-dehydrorhamnose 3,5-epimerase
MAPISDKDKALPLLKDVESIKPKKTLVIGCNGQLGKSVINYVDNNQLDKNNFIFSDTLNADLIFDITKSEDYKKIP